MLDSFYMIFHSGNPGIVGTVGQGRVCNKLHFKRIKEKPPFGHHNYSVAKGNKDLTL